MVKYKKRRKYKYTLFEDYSYATRILVAKNHNSDFIEIDTKGNLLIKAGYSWDGATTFPDLKTIMEGSLVHDALYQLMREGILEQSDRDEADRILETICIESKMSKWLAKQVYKAVKLFGKSSASKIPLTAP